MSANRTKLKSDVVEFIPNTPVLLAIKYPRSKIVQGRYGELAMFTLTDGRVCFLDLGVAEKIAGRGDADRGAFLDQLQVGRKKRFRSEEHTSELQSLRHL